MFVFCRCDGDLKTTSFVLVEMTSVQKRRHVVFEMIHKCYTHVLSLLGMPEELLSCKKMLTVQWWLYYFRMHPRRSAMLFNCCGTRLPIHYPLFNKKFITEHYLSITVCTVMLVVLLAFKWQDAVKSAIYSEIKHAHKINIMCAI